jgi:fatty-acyl-CoA synthase
MRTLPQALADAARCAAGYTFVGHGRETYRTFAEIFDASARLSEVLRRAGLNRSDVAALVLDDAEEFLTALFGASMAGIVPASLSPPAAASDRRTYLEATARALRAAGARGVLAAPNVAPLLEELISPELDIRVIPTPAVVDRIRLDEEEPAPASWQPTLDDVAFVQYTSGSTTAPKGVIITHRNLCANIEAINGPSGINVTQTDSGVSWLPLHHDMGLVGMALGALYAGRPMVLLTPEAFVKRPAVWLRAISEHRATVSFAPNFAYDLCLRRVKPRDLEGVDLSCWRVAGCGGEPIHSETLASFAARFRAVGFRETSFTPCYGLAEHVVAATLSAPGRAVSVDVISADGLSGAARVDGGSVSVVGCGRALAGHQVRVVDERGRAVEERTIGEITLAGPSVMLGYHADDDLTAVTIRDGWLHTGDLGYLSDGQLFVCGRSKDLIVINGRKYHPQDIEWAVENVPGVRRGRVVAFAATRAGSADQVVVLAEASGTATPHVVVPAIRRAVAEMCALHLEEIRLVPSGSIERTTSGKVQRVAARVRYERGEFDPRV